MKLVGLISGGKDSIFSLLHCIAAGHEIVAVANIEPEVKGEIDSYMYQSVGQEAISMVAGALALPIYRHKTKGKAVCQSKVYVQTQDDEVEDLLHLLEKVKKDMPIEGVSVGAIKSDYQRTRVENVCKRLHLVSFAYLWQRNQTELLQEMIDAEFDAIVIKVASIGLSPSIHLGMTIKDLKHHLTDLNKEFGVHVCGEGGEYETLTLDCPLFHRKISLLETEKKILSNHAFAEVGCLNIKNAELKSKIWGTDDPVKSLHIRLAYIHSLVKSPYEYIQDCVDDNASQLFLQHLKRSQEDLPFPFQNEDENEKNSMNISNVTPQRKPPPSAISVQEAHSAHSSQKFSSSPSSVSVIDTTTSNLNYTTGWACVGNITGSNMQDAFFCLQKHLERMRYELADSVLVNIYLRDMEEYQNMNKIYSQYMPEVSPPARVCVAIPLPPNTNILIVAVAHKCVSKSQKAFSTMDGQDKEILHVQSISHWAPANIGPYSQGVRAGSLFYIAGQIPLIPGTMEMLNKPIYYQCKLTLRHVLRIMQAMRESLNYSNVLQVVCYVTSEEVAHDIPALWAYITENYTATLAVFVVKSLPKNAQLELETIAIDASKPQMYEEQQVIEDCNVFIKQCLYMKPLVTSFICKVSYLRRNVSKTQKLEKGLNFQKLTSILKYCLNFIRKEAESISSSLCIIKLFYDMSESGIQEVIFELTKNSNFHHKVVITGIPVVSASTRDVFLTILGLCH